LVKLEQILQQTMDPDSDYLFREPIVYRSIALDFAAVEAPPNGSNTAAASASAGTAPAPFALGKTFAPHYASSVVAASSFALSSSEQPSFADFADPRGAGESAYRVLYAKPAYETPPLPQYEPLFAVESSAARAPSLEAKAASLAPIPAGQACPLPAHFERAWSLVVAPQPQPQQQQPQAFISAGELCSVLEAAISYSVEDEASDEQRAVAEGETDLAALRLRRTRLRSVVAQRVDMDNFAVRIVCTCTCSLISA
jgi:hypothetical protein